MTTEKLEINRKGDFMRKFILMTASAVISTLGVHADDPFAIESSPSVSSLYSSSSSSSSSSSTSDSSSSSSSFSSSDYECHHHKGRTVNTLGPLLRLTLTPSMFGENLALSLLGEGGEQMYRGSATLGFNSCDSHWFKMTAEYLSQKLMYNFSCGHEKKWIGQFAAGGAYQYKFYFGCLDSFEFSGYYSHAKSCKLKTAFCAQPINTPRQIVPADPDVIPDLSSSLEPIVLRRRIAGSNGGSGLFGFTLIPWTCGRLTFSGLYDYISYNRELTCEKTIHGFGGGIRFHQRLAEYLDVILTGEFRRPYDYVSLDVNWRRNLCDGWLDLGGFLSYTYGKSQVSCVTAAGFQFNWVFGCPQACEPTEPSCGVCCYDSLCEPKEFLSWVSKPAVYMPIVLAIPEECKGTAPTGNLENVFVPFGSTANIDTSVAFSRPPKSSLWFTATGLPTGFSIDPRTGIITGISNFPAGLVSIITVTAINGCSQATEQFVLTLGGSA
jgi:hypothetical protein